MLHFAAAGVEDDRLAIIFARLAADLREERGEAVVVVHRPAVERMVVALGALRAHAHEDLGHVLGGLQRVAFDLVEVGRRVLERAAVGAEQLLHHLVERHVVRDLLGQPVGVQEHRLVADVVGAILTISSSAHFIAQISENSLRSSSRSTSLARFAGSWSAMNSMVLLFGRQQADDVERHAAEKDFVAADLAGQDPQLLQLGVDQLVDVVGRRRGRRRVLQILGQHEHLAADGVRLEAGHHERLAAVGGGDQAVGADRGRVVVVRQEHGQVVTSRSVPSAVVGAGDQLLRGPFAFEHDLLGIEFDARDRGDFGRRRSGRPLRASA